MSATIPAPGSLAARDAGCICNFGDSAPFLAVPANCPVHAGMSIHDLLASLSARTTDNGEADQVRDPQPARLSGTAH